MNNIIKIKYLPTILFELFTAIMQKFSWII
jgi:hypothetical protein